MSSFSFSRAQRIRKRADFVRIQDTGTRVNTKHLLILLSAQSRPRPALDVSKAQGEGEGESAPARLGIVASRKIGGAVQRNRCKRLVREVFRLHPELFPPGLEVVIIVRPETQELGREALAAELLALKPLLWRRAAALLRGPAAGEASPRPKKQPLHPRGGHA